MAKPTESAIDTSAVKLLEDNEPHVIGEAGEILLKLIGNVLRDPHNIKYRSIRLSNPKIEKKLLAATGAFEILFAVGFEEDTDSLLLPLDSSPTKLRAFKAALEKVMWGRGRQVPNPGEAPQQQHQQRQATKGNSEAVVMQSVRVTDKLFTYFPMNLSWQIYQIYHSSLSISNHSYSSRRPNFWPR